MELWHYISNLCLGTTGYISWPELNLVGISCKRNYARNVQNEISWFFKIIKKILLMLNEENVLLTIHDFLKILLTKSNMDE